MKDIPDELRQLAIRSPIIQHHLYRWRNDEIDFETALIDIILFMQEVIDFHGEQMRLEAERRFYHSYFDSRGMRER